MKETVSVEHSWHTVLTPHRHWLDLGLHELWTYRDLVGMLVRRDLAATYRQTLLGPLWYVVKPLLATLLFTLVFARIAGISTEQLPPIAFYLAGLTVWDYFSTCVNQNSNVFATNKALFEKVYFPRLVVPVAFTLSNAVKLSIQYVLFLSVLLLFLVNSTGTLEPNAWILLSPVLFLILAVLSLGVGALTSAFTAKYRDLYHLLLFAVRMGFYATPIIYPASIVPPELGRWLWYNPVTPVVEAFRFAHLGQGQLEPGGLVYSAVFASMTLMAGIVAFQRVEKTFVDTA